MSHAPVQKCWNCGRPMTGETQIETRHHCGCCGFSSCGACIMVHFRKAHPSDFMTQLMPALQVLNAQREHALKGALRAAAPDNVIPLFERHESKREA